MIRAENVSKVFKSGFKAVDGVNLDVAQGDVFGFLGPNGAGKTTTIHMLTGIYSPTSGTILIDGKDIRKNAAAVKRMIGVLPESSGYYEWMSGADYLAYFGRLYGMGGGQLAARVSSLMQTFGLAGKEAVPIRHYSRGMRQRLGIAKALIHSPKVLFLDEPTLELDPAGQRDIHGLLSDLSRNMAVTIFITTHLLKDVDALCNRIALIDHGTVVEHGDIETLCRRYARANALRLCIGDNDAAMKAIAGLACIKVVESRDDSVKLTFEAPEGESVPRTKNAILERLVSTGADIREFVEEEFTIEDLFFTIAVEKEQKTLKAVLLTTISKRAIVWGKIGGALVVTCAAMLIGLPYIWALGYGHGSFGIVLLNFVVVTILSVLLVAALSAALTILMGSTRNGMLILLALLGIMAVPALLEFKVLGTGGFGAFIDRVSPTSNAILAIREVIITRGMFDRDVVWAFVILGLWLAVVLIFLAHATRRFEFGEGD